MDHSLVFATPEMQSRYDGMARDAGVFLRRYPLSRKRMAHAPVQPIVEALSLHSCSGSSQGWPVSACDDRTDGSRPRARGGGNVVVVLQALAICTIIEFAVPVAPASSSSVPQVSSGRARHRKRHEPPTHERLKMRRPRRDESSAHPPPWSRASSTGRDGPTTSHSASSGTSPSDGTNSTVRRKPASQAG